MGGTSREALEAPELLEERCRRCRDGLDDATDEREDVLPSRCESWLMVRTASMRDAFDSDMSDS